jgi:hypothetical protein
LSDFLILNKSIDLKHFDKWKQYIIIIALDKILPREEKVWYDFVQNTHTHARMHTPTTTIYFIYYTNVTKYSSLYMPLFLFMISEKFNVKLSVRGGYGRWLQTNYPSTLYIRIPPKTLDYFMWGNYPASLRNVGGSTQVPARSWNNTRKDMWGLCHQ